eukprot:scaffold224468_cov31-Tisochrysis_lutea.AAC.4
MCNAVSSIPVGYALTAVSLPLVGCAGVQCVRATQHCLRLPTTTFMLSLGTPTWKPIGVGLFRARKSTSTCRCREEHVGVQETRQPLGGETGLELGWRGVSVANLAHGGQGRWIATG